MSGFGQVVLGPPGAGKTTYCNGMNQFLSALNRQVYVVNLDPANEGLPYTCEIDIAELITLEDAMEQLELGPNGGLVYCVEYLKENIDWLLDKLRDCIQRHSSGEAGVPYFLFDFPGQVELFTHHTTLRDILAEVIKTLDIRVSVVHLVDAYHCADPAKFISVVLLSLSTMLNISLPHVNVLSKVDLIESHGPLHFNLDFYTSPTELEHILPLIPFKQTEAKSVADTAADALAETDDTQVPEQLPFNGKFQKLNEALSELVSEYSLVGFETLNIQDKDSMFNLVKVIDKTNGFAQPEGYVAPELASFNEPSAQEKYMPSTMM